MINVSSIFPSLQPTTEITKASKTVNMSVSLFPGIFLYFPSEYINLTLSSLSPRPTGTFPLHSTQVNLDSKPWIIQKIYLQMLNLSQGPPKLEQSLSFLS